MSEKEAIKRIRKLMDEYKHGYHSVYSTLGAIESILEMTE